MMADSRPTEPIQLEPFVHQVGGHSSMLCLDDATVCKPMIPRELHFYETLPQELKQFVPDFKGLIEVKFKESTDGYIILTAYPPKHYKSVIACNNCKKTKNPGIRLRSTQEMDVETSGVDVVDENISPSYGVATASSTISHGSAGLNPWVLKCHRDQLTKMAISSSGFVEFILLENLTWRYRHPCILDLKMGVRQYGDDASPAKRQRQRDKVANSTSSKLGVRICGMQVYQMDTGKFICQNKYYGRTLSVDGFKQTLRQFLHNGLRLRTELISSIVERLKALRSVIENSDGYRFYTSSLLILYDGRESNADTEESSRNLTTQLGPSGQYVNSNPNHVHVCELARSSSLDFADYYPETSSAKTLTEQNKGSGASSPSNHRDLLAGKDDRSRAEPASIERSLSCDGCENGRRPRQNSHCLPPVPKVDVRMIDFAHSTHRGFHEQCVHNGADKGYMMGLESVINFLKIIETEAEL